MKWTRVKCKKADSIQAGDYHIHKSLDLYTAYRRNPFVPIGLFKTSAEARDGCTIFDRADRSGD